jgi:hypothetical protein
MKIGVACVKGTSVWTRTQERISDGLISIQGLESHISVGDTVTLIAFATAQTKPSWNVDDYIVWSLNAPGITFSTSAQAEVIASFQTVYQIAVTGLAGVDHTCLMPATATYVSGRIFANNRGSKNPTYTYEIDSVVCTVYLCNIDGSSTLYDTVTYNNPSLLHAFPDYVAHNEGPYNQLYCDHVYPESGLPTIDPTQYYWKFRYTFQYIQI